jgi:hypothetical protein
MNLWPHDNISTRSFCLERILRSGAGGALAAEADGITSTLLIVWRRSDRFSAQPSFHDFLVPKTRIAVINRASRDRFVEGLSVEGERMCACGSPAVVSGANEEQGDFAFAAVRFFRRLNWRRQKAIKQEEARREEPDIFAEFDGHGRNFFLSIFLRSDSHQFF